MPVEVLPLCSIQMKNKFVYFVLAVIMVVLLVGTSLMVAAGPRSGLALEVDSGDCGLVVRAEKQDDTGNLNPGDAKNSHVLTAENTKNTPFRYYFNIKKVSSIAGYYREMVGRPLDHILELTVTRGGDFADNRRNPAGNQHRGKR